MEKFYDPFTGETHTLPWAAPLSVPNYTPISEGEWSLTMGKMPPMIRGYYSDVRDSKPHPVNPVLRRNKDVWMSVTPMETESLAPHAHFAQGRVVICGLGMGLLLHNILKKPEVTEVIVLEKSHDVLKMFHSMIEVESWEGHEKMISICADATLWKPHAPIDFVSVDIFQKMMCETNLKTLQKINKNLQPIAIAGWTTELEFISWCADKEISPADVQDVHYADFKRETGLPLITWDGVARYCVTCGYHTAMA